MTRLLPLVLSRFDLPQAELHAARLDGELFAIDECFAPIDLAPHASLRAAALAAIVPARLIAEQRTAAWVLGALLDPPAQHQLCADTAARYRFAGAARCTVREVVLDSDDTAVLGRLRVTTPLRTAIDLARFCVKFDAAEEDIVAGLAQIGGFDLRGAIAGLERRRHLPGKVRAAQRLRAALQSGPGVSPR